MCNNADGVMLVVPVVHVHPLAQFHLPGATAIVKCHADGVPQPEISWEKNESPFTKEATDSQRRHYFLRKLKSQSSLNLTDDLGPGPDQGVHGPIGTPSGPGPLIKRMAWGLT